MKKKIKLTKETIKSLTEQDLTKVVGAGRSAGKGGVS